MVAQKITKKDRREIIFMVTAVIFVGILGFLLQNMANDQTETNMAGLAVSLDSNSPSYSGMLYLLQESCKVVDSNGDSSCDEICESSSDICVPLEDTCSEISEYSCYCCDDLS